MKKNVIRVLACVAVLLVWTYLAYRIHNPRLFPAPLDIIIHSFPDLAIFGGDESSIGGAIKVIIINSGYTLVRVIIGSFVGIVAGIGLGFLIDYSQESKYSNVIILNLFRSIPLLTLIKLFYFWNQDSEWGIIFFIILSTMLIISTGTYYAIENIPSAYIEQAKILKLPKPQFYKQIVFPAILPEFIGTLLYFTGTIWAISLASEFLSASHGLGFLTQSLYSNNLMGGLLIIGIVYCGLAYICYYKVESLLLRIKINLYENK